MESWYEPTFAWLQSSCTSLLSYGAFPNPLWLVEILVSESSIELSQSSMSYLLTILAEYQQQNYTWWSPLGQEGLPITWWAGGPTPRSCTFLKQPVISCSFSLLRKWDLDILMSNLYHLFHKRCNIERSVLTQIPLPWKSTPFPWTSGLVAMGKSIFKLCSVSNKFVESWEYFLFLGSPALYSLCWSHGHFISPNVDYLDISTLL